MLTRLCGGVTILFKIIARMKFLLSNYLGDYSYSFQGMISKRMVERLESCWGPACRRSESLQCISGGTSISLHKVSRAHFRHFSKTGQRLPGLPSRLLLETLVAGALYREFREFMRVLTAFLGKPKEIHHNSGVSAVCTNYDGFLWVFQGKSSEFA